MANIKIAQLTNATTISDSDIVLIEDATQTKKMTVANLKGLLGINSGGIVESGSNANGRWTKFFDGTMIIYGNVEIVVNSTTPSGVLYRSTDSFRYTFPKTFLVGTKPTVNFSFEDSRFLSGGMYSVTSTHCDLYPLVRENITSPATIIGHFEVFGRWKA